MEPLNPVREGYVNRIDQAPEPKRARPFLVPDPDFSDIPASPPPEVLDSLDRAARVLAELGRKNVTVALEADSDSSELHVLLHHAGTASAEISHRALLNLLDGDTALLPGTRRV